MISKKVGKVIEVEKSDENIQWVKVSVEGETYSAINYPLLLGNIEEGNDVLLNTTAVELNLGTGGYHLVMANLTKLDDETPKEGHIIKLRYTPYQLQVMAAEEENSPWHETIEKFKSLEKMPVMIGSLHSKLAPAAIGYKSKNPNKKLVYIMTDGGALPLAFSKIIPLLKKHGLIDATITINHAFGGDYECVNVYSALATAKEVIGADAAIICMGPGVVGTGTKWGFTGIEQGEIINAVNILNGKAIAIPRITFKDRRDRHKGLSHHTLTILEQVALLPAIVSLPMLPKDKDDYLRAQIRERRLDDKHTFIIRDSEHIIEKAKQYEIPLITMGRTVQEEKFYFLAAGAAGIIAAEM